MLAVAVLTSADAQTLLPSLDSPNPQAYALFGNSVAVGDVNGDGIGDIAVGAYYEDVGSNPEQGRAYVFSGVDGSLLRTFNTPDPGEFTQFGFAIAVGDVNGDGKGDIVVGAIGESVGDNGYQGRAYVFSGADGLLLFHLDTPDPQMGAGFGWSVAVGDVNADGKVDIAVGAPMENVDAGFAQGRAYVFSGIDHPLLFALNTPDPQAYAYFGSSVAVRDVNGDGKGNIAVGVPLEDVGGNTDQGRAYVFSGIDHSLLFTLDTPDPQVGAAFGSSVAVGDVNGDGKADIAIGAPSEDVGGNTDQGRAYVFSGAGGSRLFSLDTPQHQANGVFGSSVAVGDVNGDGKADIAIGAPSEDVRGNTDQGRAYVFSGAGGSRLSSLDTSDPQANEVFGSSVAMGDVNGDGKADIAVGAPSEDVGGNTDQGRAYVFSGPAAPPPVGGIQALPDTVESAPATAEASPGSSPLNAALAAIAAVGVGVLVLGGWHVGRRRLRQR